MPEINYSPVSILDIQGVEVLHPQKIPDPISMHVPTKIDSTTQIPEIAAAKRPLENCNFQDNRTGLVLLVVASVFVAHWNLRNPQYFWSACVVLVITGIALEKESEFDFERLRHGVIKPVTKPACSYFPLFYFPALTLDHLSSMKDLKATLPVASCVSAPFSIETQVLALKSPKSPSQLGNLLKFPILCNHTMTTNLLFAVWERNKR
eukprot:2415441-Rhodomonas_salina.1